MSIYGVDLLQDNVEACRERLFEIFDNEYSAVCKDSASDDYRDAVRFVLSQNILCGNALSMMKVDAQGQDTEDFIVFPEWTFPRNDSKVKRRDFRLDVLLRENNDSENYDSFSLFDDDAMNLDLWEEDRRLTFGKMQTGCTKPWVFLRHFPFAQPLFAACEWKIV